MDWAFADRIRKFWKGKFLIKGMDTREDARLCVEHGIDGILVSNHGGRSTETLRATIEALPEVVAEVNGRIPVFVDGGFRRGTDVFKALALGAKAVGIGRPMLWGLGAFGQAGVDRVLEITAGRTETGDGQLRHADGCRHHPRLRRHARLEKLELSHCARAQRPAGAGLWNHSHRARKFLCFVDQCSQADRNSFVPKSFARRIETERREQLDDVLRRARAQKIEI